jgi:hypothetical protein
LHCYSLNALNQSIASSTEQPDKSRVDAKYRKADQSRGDTTARAADRLNGILDSFAIFISYHPFGALTLT